MPLLSSCRGLLLHLRLLTLTLLVSSLHILPDVANMLLEDRADPLSPPTAPQVLHRQEAATALVVQVTAAAAAVIEELEVDRAWAGR